MAWTDLLPPFPDLLVQSIQDAGPHLTITLVSPRLSDTCPPCQTPTQAGHGWFTRQVHSLPCSGRAVVFQIHARRFRCPNAACPRCPFREALSSVVARSQRRTPAATRLLHRVGAEVGGQAGVGIAQQMPLPASRSTLLKTTKHLAPWPSSAPRVVGVDDFAWKKGRRYGTILVDLEAHRVLALLPTCEVETVAAWFRQYKSVLIVTRDRSQTFAEAIRLGTPHALQIADRFHLHVNATTCLEAILTREQATLRQVVDTLRAQARAALPAPQPHITSQQRLSQQRWTCRHTCYEQIVHLTGQGWSRSAIARELGLHRDTVARYRECRASFPNAPRARRAPRRSMPIWATCSNGGPKGSTTATACLRDGGSGVTRPVSPWSMTRFAPGGRMVHPLVRLRLLPSSGRTTPLGKPVFLLFKEEGE